MAANSPYSLPLISFSWYIPLEAIRLFYNFYLTPSRLTMKCPLLTTIFCDKKWSIHPQIYVPT